MATTNPIEKRLAEIGGLLGPICLKYKLQKLYIYGPILQRTLGSDDEINFVVEDSDLPDIDVLMNLDDDFSAALSHSVTICRAKALELSPQKTREKIMKEKRLIYSAH